MKNHSQKKKQPRGRDRKTEKREREREEDVTCNVASLFTRIPFAIDPLCTKVEGVVRSPFPSLLGLFIRLPLAAALFEAQPCSTFVYLPTLSLLPLALSCCTNSMPDNKGDCMYYLACLPHACPDSSQSTFESRHGRYKAARSQCNAIKSNPPCILSRT